MEGSSWALRGSELEAIKQQHLLRHFQQLAFIALKHSHFAFHALALRDQTRPASAPHRIARMVQIIDQIKQRRKAFVLRYLARRMRDSEYRRAKACLLVAVFLERKVTGISTTAFLLIRKERKRTVPKDQQLFLIIKLSNLNKLLAFVKTEAFLRIKANSHARSLEMRKAKLIKMGFVLSNYVNRLLIDSFFRLARPQPQRKREEPEDGEEIFVESYKTMAVNLSRGQGTPTYQSSSLRAMKREAGAQEVGAVVELRLQSTLRGCLWDLFCFQNQRFKPSTLAVLRREIAILEQEYEST